MDFMLTQRNFKLFKMKFILFVTVLFQVLEVYIWGSELGKLNL